MLFLTPIASAPIASLMLSVNYDIDIVDELILDDIIKDTIDEDISDNLILVTDEVEDTTTLITQTLSVSQLIEPLTIINQDILHTLNFEQLAEVGDVYDIAVCQQINIRQSYHDVYDFNIEDTLFIEMYEADVIFDDLILEDYFTDNSVVTDCNNPNGYFPDALTKHDLQLTQIVSIVMDYDIDIVQSLQIGQSIFWRE